MVPLGVSAKQRDLEMLLGKDFNDVASNTEKKLWATLDRTALQNQPKDFATNYAHFTFYTCLPLEKMINVFIKHELNAADFPHTTGTPINFSLNARSAVLFYQYSLTLGRKELADNPTSGFWLCTFRLECTHLAEIKENKTLGLLQSPMHR